MNKIFHFESRFLFLQTTDYKTVQTDKTNLTEIGN